MLERCEYWRLSDPKGKPPGVVGWWPSRAVTFIENHDTGSTQVRVSIFLFCHVMTLICIYHIRKIIMLSDFVVISEFITILYFQLYIFLLSYLPYYLSFSFCNMSILLMYLFCVNIGFCCDSTPQQDFFLDS